MSGDLDSFRGYVEERIAQEAFFTQMKLSINSSTNVSHFPQSPFSFFERKADNEIVIKCSTCLKVKRAYS